MTIVVPGGGGGGSGNATSIQGVAVDPTAPTSGQVLAYNGTVWIPTAVSGTGTVTSASVVSANGFAGTVATSTTTPAITLKTTVTGVLKGNSVTGVISAAVSGTDYAPGTSAAATGLVVSTTGTGALTTVAAPTGTIVGTTDTQDLSNKRLELRGDTLTGGGTVAIDTDDFDVVVISAIGTNLSISTTGTPNQGDTLRFLLQANAGGLTVSWGSTFIASFSLPVNLINGTTLKVDFWWNDIKSMWSCVGYSPLPLPAAADLGSNNFNITNAVQSVFPTPFTVTPGLYKVSCFLTAKGNATAGVSVTAALGGGTATYTVISQTAGAGIGGRWSSPSALAADNVGMMTFGGYINVTVAGTINVQAIATATGDVSFLAQDTSDFSGAVQLSVLTAELIG